MPVSVVEGEKIDNASDDKLRTAAVPKYCLSRGEDNRLLWDPPARSRELADALSYHYPLEATLLEKMQSAIIDFFNSEIENTRSIPRDSPEIRKSAGSANFEALASHSGPEERVMPQSARNAGLPPRSAQDQEVFGVWDAKTGKPVKLKGRKRGLSPTTRLRVSQNRGNACAAHKNAKTQCDPTQCRQNKLYPGTDIESKCAKKADRREQVHQNDPASKKSHTPGLISTKKLTKDHPREAVGLLSFPSGDLLQPHKKPKDFEKVSNKQNFHMLETMPSIEEHTNNILGPTFDYSNTLLRDEELLGGTENSNGSPSNDHYSSPGCQPVSNNIQAFPAIVPLESNLDLDSTYLEQPAFQNSLEIKQRLHCTKEVLGDPDANMARDWLTSDLPSWECDWPKEEGDAQSVIPNDFGSNINTFSLLSSCSYSDTEDLPNDSQCRLFASEYPDPADESPNVTFGLTSNQVDRTASIESQSPSIPKPEIGLKPRERPIRTPPYGHEQPIRTPRCDHKRPIRTPPYDHKRPIWTPPYGHIPDLTRFEPRACSSVLYQPLIRTNKQSRKPKKGIKNYRRSQPSYFPRTSHVSEDTVDDLWFVPGKRYVMRRLANALYRKGLRKIKL